MEARTAKETTMATSTYPVHVDAQLDPQLSRWLWLLKWLLAIPHYVILGFLWLAFAVTSVIAFFGILFTGRYPRSIFDFNVGVLRWTWRVSYYAYGALGTDQYPPFTLHDVPDYPAHLEVDYPEHLSRGLVLVKWWLLALPHYIVVGLFLGGLGYTARAGDSSPIWAAGLISTLVLIAGVVLLFTGRYPKRIFDFVLGLNRWVLRVACYVGLMTDRYPPFALDQGGHEDGPDEPVRTTPAPSPAAPAPATTSSLHYDDAPSVAPTVTHGRALVPPPGTLSSPPPVTRSRLGWTAGRVIALVVGCFLAVVAVGMAVSGAILAAGDLNARDSAGFLMSPEASLSSSGYAVTSTDLQLHSDAPSVPRAIIGDTKLRATSSNAKDVFIGVARTADVNAYLAGARRSVLRDFTNSRPRYDAVGSGTLATPPTSVGIWARQASGPGTQSIAWPVENGNWTAVVMNADGTSEVAADVAAGAQVPGLWWIIGGLLVGAAVTAVAAVLLIAVPLRRVSRTRRTSR